MTMQKRILLLVGLLSSGPTTTMAFAPVVTTTTALSKITSSAPKHQHSMIDPDQILGFSDLTNHLDLSSHFLAEAAAAAASGKDLGWWGSYINFFKLALSAVHGVVDGPLKSVGIEQSWGVSIALFTCLARGLLLPLSIQQSQSAEYMKALKPYVNEIKEKFKDNQDAQNRATAKLYEDANQNPLSGCLVSLAQLPIFLGLYRGVRLLALDGQLQEPFLWIPNLEGPVSPPNYNGLDWLLQGWTFGGDGGIPVPPLGWETTIAFLIMPTILVLLQSATMQALQPPVDENASEEERKTMESTQGVLKFLPLLIGFFSLQVPAGLTIYWLASNLFTLAQSLSVKAYFSANPPKVELPEYWDQMNEGKKFEDMTPEERRQATEAGLRVGPSFDDLVTEAKFHVYVERQPFREATDSWKLLEEEKKLSELSESMRKWVLAASSEETQGKSIDVSEAVKA